MQPRKHTHTHTTIFSLEPGTPTHFNRAHAHTSHCHAASLSHIFKCQMGDWKLNCQCRLTCTCVSESLNPGVWVRLSVILSALLTSCSPFFSCDGRTLKFLSSSKEISVIWLIAKVKETDQLLPLTTEQCTHSHLQLDFLLKDTWIHPLKCNYCCCWPLTGS